MLRESPILKAIAAALGRYPQVLVRRRQVGLFLAVNWGECAPGRAVGILAAAGVGSRVVEIGTKGEPDLDVLVGGQVCKSCGAAVHPLCALVEVKSETGKQRPDQVNYQHNVAERRGVPYILARSPGDAIVALGLPLRGDQ